MRKPDARQGLGFLFGRGDSVNRLMHHVMRVLHVTRP